MHGIKHLIQCRCILPTLKDRKNPPLHKFIAFSIVDNNDVVVEKKVTCNNCGVGHLVHDICRSEILAIEGTNSSMTIEDIELMLPDSVTAILKTYDKLLPDYEHALFMIDHEMAQDFLILSSETTEDQKTGKVLRYMGDKKFRIEPYTFTEIIS